MRRSFCALRVGLFTLMPVLVPALVVGGGARVAPGEAVLMAADGPEGALDLLNDPQIDGTFVTLRLDNGDVLSGTILSVEGGFVELEHPVLTVVKVPTTRILRVELRARVPEQLESPLPGELVPPEPAPGEAPPESPAESESEPAPVEPVTKAPKKPVATWKTNIEFGVDGSQGNSERLNFRGGLRVSRETPDTTMRFNTRYVVNTTEGERSTNRFTANLRNDWRLREARWSVFAQAGVELDEFREFDARVSGGAGFAYRFFDDETTFLSTRLGAGFAREWGGFSDDYNPELILGLELSHKLTTRQTLTLTAEYYPDLDDLAEFRSVVRPAWEFRLDTKTNLSLRLGLEHRYESQSTRAKKSDLDYFATLVLSF